MLTELNLLKKHISHYTEHQNRWKQKKDYVADSESPADLIGMKTQHQKNFMKWKQKNLQLPPEAGL